MGHFQEASPFCDYIKAWHILHQWAIFRCVTFLVCGHVLPPWIQITMYHHLTHLPFFDSYSGQRGPFSEFLLSLFWKSRCCVVMFQYNAGWGCQIRDRDLGIHPSILHCCTESGPVIMSVHSCHLCWDMRQVSCSLWAAGQCSAGFAAWCLCQWSVETWSWGHF